MKAKIPASIPASIESAKAGLAAISAKIVSPDGTDLYIESVNDVPMKNNIGIAIMSPTDNLPKVVFGRIFQVCFFILLTFTSEYHTTSLTLLFPTTVKLVPEANESLLVTIAILARCSWREKRGQ